MKRDKILVIGSGAWGTAIANLVAKNGYETFISANDPDAIAEINAKTTNQKFLPKVKLCENIIGLDDYKDEIHQCKYIFIVTPSFAVEQVLKKMSKLRVDPSIGLIICSKGLDHKRLKFFSELASEILPLNKLAILSGPNFALEVAQEAPTITTIASIHKPYAKKVVNLLNNEYFSAKYFDDPITVEICGLIKNVIAIACGITDGLKMGENAKAAIVNLGIEEILILCKKLKGKGNLANPAGFGDIFLTCATTKSRNNSLGSKMAKGKSYEQIVKETNTTYEGVNSAISGVKIAKKLKIRLILCEIIAKIVDNSYNPQEIEDLITKAIFQK